MGSSIVRIDPLADPRWDEFLATHPRGSVWHSSAWVRVTQRTYGYRPAHLAFERDGALEGILPLVLVDSRLTGRRLGDVEPEIGSVTHGSTFVA